MPVIVLTTATGAPGASTTALGLALLWPGPTLLVEADPAGTSIVSGWYGGGVDPSPRNLLNLALGDPRADLSEAIFEQVVRLDDPPLDQHQRLLLIGLSEPAQATALEAWWNPIGAALQRLSAAGYTVIVDAGRLTQGSYPVQLLGYADQVFLVCRSTLASVLRSYPMARTLHRALEESGNADTLGVLVVDDPDGPFAAAEIGRELGVGFSVSVPYEPRNAATLSDGAARRQTLLARLKGRLRRSDAVDEASEEHGTARTTDAAAVDADHAAAGADATAGERARPDSEAVVGAHTSALLRSLRSTAREIDAHIQRRNRRLQQPASQQTTPVL